MLPEVYCVGANEEGMAINGENAGPDLASGGMMYGSKWTFGTVALAKWSPRACVADTPLQWGAINPWVETMANGQVEPAKLRWDGESTG